MPRPKQEDKPYAELLLAASLTWLIQPQQTLEGLDIFPKGKHRTTLQVYALSPAILVQMIHSCTALPSFRMDYRKHLAALGKLSSKQQYEAVRDAISAMRYYGLIQELVPKAKSARNPSPVCKFEIVLHQDVTQPANHGTILAQLFKQGGQWDRAAKPESKSKVQKQDPAQTAQLQHHLDTIVGWIADQLLPETLTGYDYQKAASLNSLVDVLRPLSTLDALPEGSHLASLLIKLATHSIFQSQLEQAYALLEQAHSLRLTPTQKASSLHYLGIIYHKRQDFALAEQHYLQALQLRESVLGECHPLNADTTAHLAELYIEWEQLDKAKPWLEQALHRQQQSYGSDHPMVALTLNAKAYYHAKLQDWTSAVSFYQQALQVAQDPTQGRIYRAVAWKGLGNLAAQQANYAQAERYYLQAYGEVVEHYGVNHPNVAMILASLAGVYHGQGRSAESKQRYLQALDILKNLYGYYHPLIGEYLSDWGYLLSQDSNNRHPAQVCFERAIEILSKFYPPDHPRLLRACQGLEAVRQEV